MSFQEEWDEFINNLFCNAVNDEYEKSANYKRWAEKQDQIDEFLNTQLTKEQKSFVDDILFEMTALADQKAKAVYIQGYKDCISLLKSVDLL